MTLLPCPYENSFSPYVFAKQNNAIWLNEIEEQIKEMISTLNQQLIKEAEYCSDTDLLDPKFMYVRFKENCKYDMYFGNWSILKYFIRIMKIKLLNEIIGNWTYTEEDKEMYEYFFTFEINDKNKPKQNTLKYKSCVEDNMSIIRSNLGDMYIWLEFKTDDISANNVSKIHYYRFFDYKFQAIDNLARNAKMLQKYNEDFDFFSEDCFKNFDIITNKKTFGNEINYSITEILQNWQKEAKKPKNVKPQDFYLEAEKYANANPLYNKLTAERALLYNKLLKEFMETSKGKLLYSCLPDEYKEQIMMSE